MEKKKEQKDANGTVFDTDFRNDLLEGKIREIFSYFLQTQVLYHHSELPEKRRDLTLSNCGDLLNIKRIRLKNGTQTIHTRFIWFVYHHARALLGIVAFCLLLALTKTNVRKTRVKKAPKWFVICVRPCIPSECYDLLAVHIIDTHSCV